MTKQKLPLDNITSIETENFAYNKIITVSEATFEGRAWLVFTHESGKGHAVLAAEVKLIEYEKREREIKTLKDVYDAWKEGRLVEI